MILLMFDAAARVQEVLDLTVADIDTTPGAGRVILTGKGRKTRVVPIMDKTGRHLDQYLNLFHPGRRRRRRLVVLHHPGRQAATR